RSFVPLPIQATSVQWFHIAGGYDAATGALSLYVNGVEALSNGVAGAQSSDGSPVVVGTVKNGPDVVAPGGVGYFDDIQIFDAPLSAADVQALRANPGQG